MKRIITILAIFALIFAFGANMALAAEKKPKEYKLSFITGLSGPLAAAAQTQKLAIELLVEQYNAKGGLNMPWGKIPIKLSIADDEMKLDVGVRRFREAVEAGANGVSGSIYNPMSAALNEET
ncbi:MAG: ABC transporter substrate-binding protein, partial [Desulfobacterales bacterium]